MTVLLERDADQTMARRLGAMEPYALPALLVLTTIVGLIGDALTHDLAAQQVLGLLTFAVLAVAAWSMPRYVRNQIWLLVLVSVGIELFGSVIWGAYRYRFHNVPLYVPPGHGIVYLFSLRMAVTPWFERHGRGVVALALAVATAWMAAGLFIWPHINGRLDVFGALCWPLLVAFTLRTGRALLFAAAFFATSGLELLGTTAGDWSWSVSTPVVHIATGNPPSVIAGLYCVLDATVLMITRGLLRAAGHSFPHSGIVSS